MEEQLQIIEQLKKTLQLLTLEQSKLKVDTNSSQSINSNMYEEEIVTKDFLYQDCAELFIDFTYKHPTTYHVVKFASEMLKKNGFHYLPENENWNDRISKGGKFYTTRNGTSFAAFVIGKNWKPENGTGVIASHIDSLTVKLKPSSIKDHVEGFELLGVAPYGGTLNSAWFDRDLGIAGKIIYKKDDGKIESTLIDSTPYPIAKIPSLAPHFGAPAEGPFDKEDQAVPIIGYVTTEGSSEPTEDEKKCPLVGKHSIHLLRYIAKMANIKVSQIIQTDLDLFDVQKGTLGGLNQDFIFAPRLDDRLCSFAATWGFDMFAQKINTDNFDGFSVLALFDNEEVGSLSRQGAKGGLLESVVQHASYAVCNTEIVDLYTVFANSVILSADVNHMFNPNFSNVYLKNHSPKPNVGVTISLDPNAHMSTDVVALAFVEELARNNGDDLQYFHIKNNSRSGGTIGPSIQSQTGALTVDLGIAQLSMHSIRAATGSRDVGLGIKFFLGFYQKWKEVFEKFNNV
ncbi:hypothetical protein KAFR_0D03190 [Kazachstania africana CBS 2517]|uniref:Uncharacterized protein n=1 Tax=Kazachstania africana (strain ATCC 22294 / BCRC 22015 / CBS 2517 / CECT 1963 / NBRC 1671 / NRRL Y-8276) TaxID=1071382 RepID=H2AUB7_KAZAF|nr:hypothetical protein KAFR_0D03190 [Kazachstania africana CBS 2517]CCF57967.1 hypothetical protein KAFR_0D03190 [Kazachstania africana CBS 2517]